MPPKEKELEPWRNSRGKKILRKGIVDGIYPESMPVEVIHQSHELFKERPLVRFKDNLKNLRAAIAREQGRADADEAALKHDLQIHPTPANSKDYPRWAGSAAAAHLKADVDAGLHKQMAPKELRQTRKEYEEFPLDVFRNHITQEVRSRTTSAYWLNIMKKKKGSS